MYAACCDMEEKVVQYGSGWECGNKMIECLYSRERG